MRCFALGVLLSGCALAAAGADEPNKELLGRWVSQDGAGEPLVFEKDGGFKCGFVKEKGEWVMAAGKYTVAAGGKIKTEARYEGSTLYRTFTLKNGVITGERGLKLNVEWKKDKP
jgi:uncharacterized protein (TIGR03066 family)